MSLTRQQEQEVLNLYNRDNGQRRLTWIAKRCGMTWATVRDIVRRGCVRTDAEANRDPVLTVDEYLARMREVQASWPMPSQYVDDPRLITDEELWFISPHSNRKRFAL